MNICTIVASNYLAHARVLARSFTRHHPGAACHVLLVDDVEELIDEADEPFAVVRPSDLELSASAFDEMRAAYSVLELSTALKPWLLRYMLREEQGDARVAYLDPDVRIESRMEELDRALRDHPIVLVGFQQHAQNPRPGPSLSPDPVDVRERRRPAQRQHKQLADVRIGRLLRAGLLAVPQIGDQLRRAARCIDRVLFRGGPASERRPNSHSTVSAEGALGDRSTYPTGVRRT